MNETKGSFSIVLPHEPRLQVALKKGGLARGSNYNNSDCAPIKEVIACTATSLEVLIDDKLIWSSHMLGL